MTGTVASTRHDTSKSSCTGTIGRYRDTAIPRSRLLVPLDVCLAQVVACQPAEIATLDSTLRLRRGSLREIEEMAQAWSVECRALLKEVDGSAESFIESILRVRLRRAGIDCRPQVPVAGRYRLDLLVGNRLVIEVDGYDGHHERKHIESDRQREAVLVALGFRILRFTHRQVMYDWASVLGAVLACVERGDHLWPAGRRRPPPAPPQFRTRSLRNSGDRVRTTACPARVAAWREGSPELRSG
jgi:very-short-patch-repair endonuclease